MSHVLYYYTKPCSLKVRNVRDQHGVRVTRVHADRLYITTIAQDMYRKLVLYVAHGMQHFMFV